MLVGDDVRDNVEYFHGFRQEFADKEKINCKQMMI